MTKHIIDLDGMQPAPLADYLKAIGVLRLVCEQVDSSAMGWWVGDRFRFASTLTKDDLCDFFLHEYKPTPLIAPWNGGSGFFKADQKGAWHKGFELVMNSVAPRFEPYRNAIAAGKALLGERAKKFDAKESELKQELLRQATFAWRGTHEDWLNAAFSINHDGSPIYPAMLGTGGNDGRLDFTNNFMQRLAELFDLASDDATPSSETPNYIREAVFGELVSNLQSAPIGQFDPGGAGGVNSGSGFQTSGKINPFDFLLMLEGTIAFAPAIVRKTSTSGSPQAAVPFAVYAGSGGFSTSVADEKNRGEQWLPLWGSPTRYTELKQVLSEARCRVGSSKADRPRDVAQAIARCGVTRGISGFQRFSYLERNGQANLAVSLGRWNVGAKVPYADLLPQIDSWIDGLERAARGNTAPQSWQRHSRVINDAIMDCCRSGEHQGHSPRSWQRLLVALGNAEATILQNPRAAGSARLRPLFYGRNGLSARWIEAASDRSVKGAAELRLAVALACQNGPQIELPKRPKPNYRDPIRRHFVPLNQDKGNIRRPHSFAVSDESLMKLNEVVVRGADPNTDLISFVKQRLQIANRRNDWHYMPIVPFNTLAATPRDLQSWINGEVDRYAVISMARALMAIDWNDAWYQQKTLADALAIDSASKDVDLAMLGGWATIRLCFHWDDLRLNLRNASNNLSPLKKHVGIAIDPKIFANLVAGRADVAVQFAARRLMVSGLPVRLNTSLVSSATAKNWAATLAWSMSHYSMNSLASKIVHRAGVAFEPEPITES